MNPLDEALGKGQSALNEYQAKQVLAGFGVPTCREALARDPEQAVAEAARIGFPVVLKAAGATLLHKTEVGGVALNLKSPAEVKEQASRLLKIPGCETLLVQEMIQGDRELVCGLTRDAQFGPCVMFGLGGVLTEVLGDTVFRVAPLTLADAAEMMGEIRGVKFLGPFRGQQPADKAALAKIQVALGAIALQHEAIRAIDLNPVKIRPDGSLVAVDALISLSSTVAAKR